MRKLLPLSLIPLFALSSCVQKSDVLETKMYYFDTLNEVKLFEGDENNLKDIKDIFYYYDQASDNFNSRSIKNVFYINHSRGNPVTVEPDVYELLKASFNITKEGPTYFNPLAGGLSNLWKESLKKSEIPSESQINEQLEYMKNTTVSFLENNVIHRVGNAEIDLGGIAKGYTLDKVKSYLSEKSITKYLVNAGQSSVLLGEKNEGDGYFSVGISELDNTYIKLKNCVVSTSGVNPQGVKIGDVTYSHIVNPITGSAINNYDAVVVISPNGTLGDAFSTSFMLSSLDEIKEAEAKYNLQVITIKDKQVLYKSNSLELLNH